MIYCIILVIVFLVILMLWMSKNDYRIFYLDLRKVLMRAKNPISEVKKHYDENHEAYLTNYGEIIQAHRTITEGELLEYIAKNARLKDGQNILDAGCGVGGPSVYFAKKLDSKIDGLTISNNQFATMQKAIEKEQLQLKLCAKEGDYHRLDSYYEENHFDRVLFLESLGHAEDVQKVIKSANKVLKPGGLIYIKDFVKRDLPNSAYDKEHVKGLKDMLNLFRYNTLDIYHIIYILRKEGFDLVSIKEPDFVTDGYDVNKSFAAATGIVVGRPESFGVQWKYEYPPFVDPIEILFQKRMYKI